MKRLIPLLAMLLLASCGTDRGTLAQLAVPCSTAHPCNATPAHLRPAPPEPIPDGAIGFGWVCGNVPPADSKAPCLIIVVRRNGKWVLTEGTGKALAAEDRR